MNRVNLIGRLTRDIELQKGSANDVPYVKMSVALNDGKNGKAIYITVVAWRELAENCARFLKKGSKIGVDGRIDSSTYVDSQGARRKTFNVVAERVEFLSPKESRSREDEDLKLETPSLGEAMGLPEIEDLPWN